VRKRLIAATGILPAAFLLAPAAASAMSLDAQYQHAYAAVRARLGVRAPGRNIVDHGLSTGAVPSSARIEESLQILHRMVGPTPVPSASRATLSSAPVPHLTARRIATAGVVSDAIARHVVPLGASGLDGDGDHDGDMTDEPVGVHHAASRVVHYAVRHVDDDGDYDGDASEAPSVAVVHQRYYPSAAVAPTPVYHHHYYSSEAMDATPVHHYSSASGDSAPASGLAACIVRRESSGNPQDVSGQYSGLANWSQEAWQEDGGSRYASTPTGASASQQMAVLNSALAAGKASQWTPYDGC